MLQGCVSKRTRLGIDNLLDDFRLENRPAAQDLPREISEILSHINEALFDSRLNVRVLKERCHIRDNNISSRFRYFMGISIKEYIEELRLEAAELLLRESAISIFEVAASIGYYHLQTFYRVFQRKHDCTPAEYRKAIEPPGAPASVLRRSILGLIFAGQILDSLAEMCTL